MGYAGNTWTGEVTAVDNAQRSLTLTFTKKGNTQTFVATIPDAPYQWTRNGHNARVLDFPYDKTTKSQTFVITGGEFAGTIVPPGDAGDGRQNRPNPPDTDRIPDLSDFMGREITVYYTERERIVNGKPEKYNDVWRVQVLPKKKT